MLLVLFYLNMYHYNLHVVMYNARKYFIRILIVYVYVTVNMQRKSLVTFILCYNGKKNLFKLKQKFRT